MCKAHRPKQRRLQALLLQILTLAVVMAVEGGKGLGKADEADRSAERCNRTCEKCGREQYERACATYVESHRTGVALAQQKQVQGLDDRDRDDKSHDNGRGNKCQL